jgi:hypothetical protein
VCCIHANSVAVAGRSRRLQSNAAASGDETLEPSSSTAPLAGRFPLSVPGDEPAAGALQELPARQVRDLRCPGM